MPVKLKTEYLPVTSLKVGDKNPRTIKDVSFQKLCASIKEDPDFFEARPILCNKKKQIFAGNQRFAAAVHLGMTSVPVIIMDDSSLEKKRMLRDNISSGEWDLGILASDFDIEMLKDVGFNPGELAKIPFQGLDDNHLNDAPPVPEKATAKLGEMFQLGQHRLLCGDSCKAADVQRLMGKESADLVFTDPPYNVDYGVKGRKILNDSMNSNAFYSFLLAAFKNLCAFMKPGAAVYICHADTERLNFLTAMTAAGLVNKEVLIWVKNALVMGRQDYHWRHEPILYGWKPGASHSWYGDRKGTTVLENFPCLQVVPVAAKNGRKIFHVTVSTAENHVSFECSDVKVLEAFTGDKSSVWYFNRPTSSKEHPTMKPVELICRALNNSSKREDIVLDLFGGSGSTLIACEHTGRQARLMELSPKFVDVIISRWETATGKKARKL